MRKIAIHLTLLVAFVAANLHAAEPRGRPPAVVVDGVANVKAFGAKGDGRTDDTAAIQAAIDAVSYTDLCKVGTVLFPTGYYRITAPLYVGYDFVRYPDPTPSEITHFGSASAATRPGRRKNRVHLKGLGSAVLMYLGPRTNKYMLYYSPAYHRYHQQFCITNIGFECLSRTRGLFAYGCTYGCRFSNLEFAHSLEVAFDAVYCYGAHFPRILFGSCKGIAFRASSCGNAILENWKVDTISEDPDSFPNPLEDAIVDAGDRFIQTPVAGRASVILNGGLGAFRMISFETPKNGVHPAVYVGGSGWRLSDLRFEQGEYTETLIRVADLRRNVMVDGVWVYTKIDAESVIECAGSVYNSVFRNVFGQGAKAGVVFRGGDGDQVYGNKIDQIMLSERSGYNPVPPVVFHLTGTGEQKCNRVNGVLTSPIPLEASATPSLLGSLKNTDWGRGMTSLVGESYELPASANVLTELRNGYEGQLISIRFVGDTWVRSTGNIAMNRAVIANTVIYFHNAGGTWQPIVAPVVFRDN